MQVKRCELLETISTTASSIKELQQTTESLIAAQEHMLPAQQGALKVAYLRQVRPYTHFISLMI